MRVPRSVSVLVLAIPLSLAAAVTEAAPCANSGVPGTPYQGFGASTSGGAGKPIYRVTTLADSGPGSLRDAVSEGNRCVVFDVAGNIVLQKQVYVQGAFVTIDGFSAPSPGITVLDFGIGMWGDHGAHDIIMRGLRFRNAGQRTCGSGQCWDAIQLKNGVHHVVLDHISSDHGSDGALDITTQAGTITRDITVQWSIFSGTTHQVLMNRAARISMHHNLFIDGQNRNPQADWDPSLATNPPDTVLDFRNNVVWNYTSYGTLVMRRATANVVGNYYYSPSRPTADEALVVDLQGRVYASSNHSGNGANVNGLGTQGSSFAAPSVSTSDACSAAYAVQDFAGARGVNLNPDSIDNSHLGRMPATQLPGCSGSSSPSSSPTPSGPDLVVTSVSAPSALPIGRSFTIQLAVANRGTAAAGASKLRIYLSTDTRLASGDVLLHERTIASLAAGASQGQTVSATIPAQTGAGSYSLLLVANADGVVRESNSSNNTVVAQVSVSSSGSTGSTADLVTTNVSIPSSVQRGVGFPLTFNVANRGGTAVASSRVNIYLSKDTGLSTTDVLMRSRYVPAMAANSLQTVAITEIVPTTVAPGSYYLLLMVDQERLVGESNEGNNLTVTAVTVR